MGELTTSRLVPIENGDGPSRYTRMIPGVSAIPRSRVAPRSAAASAASSDTTLANAAAISSANARQEMVARKTPALTPIQQLLPHPTGDRLVLFQLVQRT